MRPPSRELDDLVGRRRSRLGSWVISSVGAVGHEAPQRREQAAGGVGVEPGRRLVEHEHGRVLQQRARHRHAAALAARQRAAALAGARSPGSSASADRVERRAHLLVGRARRP